MSALNVYIVMQGGFEHELHAFVVAWEPTAHTPTSPPLAEQNSNFGMSEHAEKLRKNLGVPIGIRTITEKREVCSDFIPKITLSVVCGWYDGRSGGSA